MENYAKCLIVSPARDPQDSAVFATKLLLERLTTTKVTVWQGYSGSHAPVFEEEFTYVADFGFLNPVDTLDHLLIRCPIPMLIDVFNPFYGAWHLYSPRMDGTFPLNENSWLFNKLREAKVSYYRAGNNDSESSFMQLNEPRRVVRIPSRHYQGPCG